MTLTIISLQLDYMPGTELVFTVASKGLMNSTPFHQIYKTVNMDFKYHFITDGVQGRQPSLTSMGNVSNEL